MKTLLPLFALCASMLSAQNSESYKVDLTIKEEGAKPRKFSTLVDSTGQGSIRVNTRTPSIVGRDAAGKPVQWNYLDHGVAATIKVRNSSPGKVQLTANVDVSLLTPMKAPEGYSGASDMISTFRMDGVSIVPLQKPTLLAGVEDPATLRKFELEVTVTPVP